MRSSPMPVLLWLIPALAAPAPAQQAEPIVTDRPDQTESSLAVPVGMLQIETGWSFSQNGEAGDRVRRHAIPETLVRVGVARRLEARLGFNGWQRTEARTSVGDAAASGTGDIEVGFKYQLRSRDHEGAQIALLADVALPTGADGFSAGGVTPVVRLAVSHELSPRVATGYNVGLAAFRGPDDRWTVEALYTWAVGIALAGRVGAFVEVFGTAGSAPAETAALLDGGITVQVSSNLQADISGGFGLTAAVDDWFTGVGLSLRLPR